MKPNLGTTATIVTMTLTVCVLLLVTTGPLLAIVCAIVSAAALGAWLGIPERPDIGPAVIVPYIGVIVVDLLMNAARYWSGFPQHLATSFPGLFVPDFASADAIYFSMAVSLPLSLLLAGGYALLRGYAIGRYAAWWAVIFAMADGLLQIAVEFATAGYEHRYFIGAILAGALIALAIAGWMRLIGRSAVPADRPYRALSGQEKFIWSVGFVAFVVAYGVTLYRQAGYMPVVIIVGSMFGGLFAWLRTTAVVPVDRLKIVPLYLLMLALFYIHVGEEGLTGFAHGIAVISGNPWSDFDFFEVIGLLGPALWVAAAAGMWLRQPWGDFLVWFLTVGMILGEPTHHIVFPVVAAVKLGVGYSYFPGMVTALFPMIPAILIAVSIFADTRQAVRTMTAVRTARGSLSLAHD